MVNPFSWTLDVWFTVLQMASAVILSLTIAVGYLNNQRKSRDMQQVKLEVAKQQERAAVAEKETLELRQKLMRIGSPRWALLGPLDEHLKGKPVASFEVLFVAESDEAHRTALWLESALSASGGWPILKGARPISPNETDLVLPQYSTAAMKENPFNLPFITRIGGWGEFSIIASPLDLDEMGFPKRDTGANAVMFALAKCDFQPLHNTDSRLPRGSVRIIVGPRQ